MQASQPTFAPTTLRTVIHSHNVYRAAIVIIALVATALFLYRLAEYPAPWYDEGSHLHVAKSYALYGIYADYSSEGIRYYGPAVGVGPTVMLPIAAAFRIFGVSIPLARLVIAMYGVLSLAALYLLGRQLLTTWGTLAFIVLVLLSPGTDFIFNARTVLGEVPGLFFLATGLSLWLRRQASKLYVEILVGILMGLACITKNQIALFVLPGMFLAWIADLVWYKQRGWRYFVVPGLIAGVVFAAWTYVVIVALGEKGDMQANLATLRSATSGAFFLFDLDAIQRALTFLLNGSVFGAMFVPAVLYGCFLSLRRDEEGQRYSIVTIMIITATALFMTSLAWPRYAFHALVLAGLLVVRLFLDLTHHFRFDWGAVRALVRGENVALDHIVIMLLATVWVINVYVLAAYPTVHAVVSHGRSDAYEVAQYLDSSIPKDAVIETWEQELGVLTDHNYHYPPQVTLAQFVAQQWTNGPAVRSLYKFLEYCNPEYVVMGEFSKYAFLYPPESMRNYEIIKTIGVYDVYERKG